MRVERRHSSPVTGTNCASEACRPEPGIASAPRLRRTDLVSGAGATRSALTSDSLISQRQQLLAKPNLTKATCRWLNPCVLATLLFSNRLELPLVRAGALRHCSTPVMFPEIGPTVGLAMKAI